MQHPFRTPAPQELTDAPQNVELHEYDVVDLEVTVQWLADVGVHGSAKLSFQSGNSAWDNSTRARPIAIHGAVPTVDQVNGAMRLYRYYAIQGYKDGFIELGDHTIIPWHRVTRFQVTSTTTRKVQVWFLRL